MTNMHGVRFNRGHRLDVNDRPRLLPRRPAPRTSTQATSRVPPTRAARRWIERRRVFRSAHWSARNGGTSR